MTEQELQHLEETGQLPPGSAEAAAAMPQGAAPGLPSDMPAPSIMDRARELVQGAAAFPGQLQDPITAVATSALRGTGAVDAVNDAATAPPGALPQTPPPPEAAPLPPPEMAGGAGGGDVVLPKAPVMASAAKEMAEFKAASKNAVDGIELSKKAIEAESKNQLALQDAAQILNVEEQKKILALAQLQRDALLTSNAEAKRSRDAALAIQARAAEAASNPLDPNRYWNNKNAGQKAAAIIAGALFGYTGKGMQWLQRLDSLVAEDMRAQESDRTAKVRGLEAQADRLGKAGQEALQAGATVAEAHKIEELARVQGLKSTLEMYTQKLTTSQHIQRAAEMSAGLSQKEAALMGEVAQLAANSASEQSKLRADLYQSELRAAMAARQSQGQSSGTQLNVGQEGDISSIRTAGAAIGDMWKQYEAAAGSTGSGTASVLLPAGVSAAADWDKNLVNVHAKLVGRFIEQGRMTDPDYAAYVKSFIPKATDSHDQAKRRVDALIKHIDTKYRVKYDTLKRTGRDVSGLIPPDQVLADMRKNTFESPAVVKAKK